MTRFRAVHRVVAELSDRFGAWPRRVAAAGCLAVAALSAWSGPARSSEGNPHATPARISLFVAAHDLAAGTVLAPGDLRSVDWPATIVPVTALRDVRSIVARTVAGPVGVGEVFTTARLQGRGLSVGLPAGQVAVSTALADPGNAQLLQPGDRVDLLTTRADPDGLGAPGPATMLAQSVRVLAVIPASDAAASDQSASAHLIVAASTGVALRIAGAVGAPVVATLRAPP